MSLVGALPAPAPEQASRSSSPRSSRGGCAAATQWHPCLRACSSRWARAAARRRRAHARRPLGGRRARPACEHKLHALLFFKGFLGIQAQRIMHFLWADGRRPLACLIQSRVSEVFGMDLHPGARLGGGLMIDHATGIVVGETSVLGDNCTLYHGVTLGGTGKMSGDRHPKLGAACRRLAAISAHPHRRLDARRRRRARAQGRAGARDRRGLPRCHRRRPAERRRRGRVVTRARTRGGGARAGCAVTTATAGAVIVRLRGGRRERSRAGTRRRARARV